MTDLRNSMSKQQLPNVALIIVIPLKIVTLKTFWPVPPAASGRLLLGYLCLITSK